MVISNRPSSTPRYIEPTVLVEPPEWESPQPTETDTVINAFGSLSTFFQNIQDRKNEHEAKLKKDKIALTKYAGELTKVGYSADDAYNIARMQIPHSSRTFKEAQENQVRASLALNHNPAHTTIPAFAQTLQAKKKQASQLAQGKTPDGWERTFSEVDLANPTDIEYATNQSLPTLVEIQKAGVLGPDLIQSSVEVFQRSLPIAQKIQYERNIKALKESVYIGTDNMNQMVLSGQKISQAAQQQYVNLIGTIPVPFQEEASKEIVRRTTNFIKEARDHEGIDVVPWSDFAHRILPNGKTYKEQIGYDAFENLQDNEAYINNLSTNFTEQVNDLATNQGVSYENDPIRFNALATNVLANDPKYTKLSEYERKTILAEATKPSDITMLASLNREYEDGNVTLSQYRDTVKEWVLKGYISSEDGDKEIERKQRGFNDAARERSNSKLIGDSIASALQEAQQKAEANVQKKAIGAVNANEFSRRLTEMDGLMREGRTINPRDPQLDLDYKRIKVLHKETEGNLAAETVKLVFDPLVRITNNAKTKIDNAKSVGFLQPDYFTNYMNQQYPNGYTEAELDAEMEVYGESLGDLRQAQDIVEVFTEKLNDPMFGHYGLKIK